MANTHTSLSALFTDIADAIREKTGDAGTIVADEFPDMIRNSLQAKPTREACLTFSSPGAFTIGVYNTTKNWDGTLEYLDASGSWTTWDGTTSLSSIEGADGQAIYLRGIGNTKITSNNTKYRWVISGTDVRCNGNIENLLDYATVESGEHPTMTNSCYANMFNGCTGLTQAPSLPATTLVVYCYDSMFRGCTGLTTAPSLPATTLTNYCYRNMFRGCTGLTTAPSLPATTLKNSCYANMFSGCTGLTQAPSLPATTLANYCYQYMFNGCTGLTQAPSLPATTLVDYCYQNMFYGCTGIKLSSTKTIVYTYPYRIPNYGTGTTATDSLTDMFTNTGGTFTGTPEINTTYYTSRTESSGSN